MNKIKLIVFCAIVLLITGCKNNSQKLSTEKTIEINDYLDMESSNTLGLAVSVIKDGTVLYENYLGKENLNGKSVNKETIFPLYSLSKLITSIAIFHLIEENKINLDDEIFLYIEGLPKAWRNIQIKHLLTHSSGLPDYDLMNGKASDSETLENIFKDKLRFKTGEQWEYNQTNFWFLTKIIEKVTNQRFENYIKESQFPANDILFSSNFIDALPNRSFKYNFNITSQKWEKVNLNFGKRANSAGGMNLTLNQFVAWNRRFDNNDLIKSVTKDEMWTSFNYETPFYFENDKDKFLQGWQQYSTNNVISYGFTGGMVTGYRKFVNQNMTIIVLSNGLKKAPIRNKIINKIAGLIDENLAEQNE